MDTVKENELEWYNDRVKTVYSQTPEGPAPEILPIDEAENALPEKKYDTPKAVYDYLNQHVWKQDDAKKAAAVIVYKCLHGIKDNAMFIGPTGCGKTHIWRCLKEIFLDRIEIVDGYSITQDG